MAGGGIGGALAALRRNPRAGQVVAIGHELMDITGAALLDGTMNLALSQPPGRLAQTLIGGMITAINAGPKGDNFTCIVHFEIHTCEKV